MNRFFLAALYLPLYSLCIALACVLWRSPILLSACFLAVGCLMLYRWHTRSDVAHFFSALILGPVGELFAVQFGVWSYPAPAALIPVWLPLAWGISGLYLKKTTEALAGNQLGGDNDRKADVIVTNERNTKLKALLLQSDAELLTPLFGETLAQNSEHYENKKRAN